MTLPIRKLFFDEKLPLGFEIISLTSLDVQSKDNLKAPHRASFYLIFWFQGGCPVHIIDFTPITVKTDSFLFVRKDGVQFFDQRNDFTSRVILFTEDFFCLSEKDHHILQTSTLFNDFRSDGRHINIASTETLQVLWNLMENEANREPDNRQGLLLQKFLSSFLVLSERENQRLVDSDNASMSQIELVNAFKNQLESDYKKEKTVTYYRDKLFVSDKVLTHALQSITGKTPKQFIDERVMLEAKRLLIHGQKSAKIVAISLGFEEPTNFNKFFKKHSGKTPTAFRLNYIDYLKGVKVSS